MQPIFTYIKDFYRKEFKAAYFIIILLMLGLLVYCNYWHFLERRYAAGGHTRLSHFTGYYFLYFIPFAAAFFLQPLFYKNCSYFKKSWFWAILIIAPAIFSFRINFDYHYIFIKNFWLFISPSLMFLCPFYR